MDGVKEERWSELVWEEEAEDKVVWRDSRKKFINMWSATLDVFLRWVLLSRATMLFCRQPLKSQTHQKTKLIFASEAGHSKWVKETKHWLSEVHQRHQVAQSS